MGICNMHVPCMSAHEINYYHKLISFIVSFYMASGDMHGSPIGPIIAKADFPVNVNAWTPKRCGTIIRGKRCNFS